MVAHTDAHGDYIAGDHQFVNRPNTVVVGHEPKEVEDFFEIENWPIEGSLFELGARGIDIVPFPAMNRRASPSMTPGPDC